MQVKLFGTHNRTVKVKPSRQNNHPNNPTPLSNTTENSGRERNTDPAAEQHRRASFASLRKILPRMHPTVSENDVWNYIKDEYSVTSRSHLYTEEWARVSARFNAADRSTELLKGLIHEVSKHKNRKQNNEHT